jgi:hypothetical protein
MCEDDRTPMRSSFAPQAAPQGTLAELLSMTPESYRPDLVTAEQIEQHLLELDGRWFNEDLAVFGLAHQLARRHPAAERGTWWLSHIQQRALELQVEHQRRRDECERLEAEYNARQKAERRAQRKAERQAAKQAEPTAPAAEPTQPTKPAPIWHQIPAELQARNQWVCWRREARDGKPTKRPYNARTARPASSTAPRTWSSFQEAKDAYLARPDFFDGIGYVFSKDDPYSGADFDHCIDDAGAISSWAAERIAALRAAGAYIEVSVSGSGVHAITRATVGKGRKTVRGEVYDRGRFFTVSGRALDPTPIGDGQAAIDALATELGGSTTASDTTARAAGQPTAHSEAEWEQARQLLRTERDRPLKRFLAATQKEETQGFFAARGQWAVLHSRYPFIGLYRADGSLDDSQARAVLAHSIRPRGFTFPEYVVIMSHHFAAYCLAKWGTKDAWRAELERLWDAAPPAKHAPLLARKPDVAISPKPRGRASNHAAQVERVYGLLLDHRAGAQALVQTAELASEAGLHRVTLAGILAELRETKRITTARNGRYGGLIVSFPDVAIVAAPEAAQPIAAAQTAIEPPAPLEETRVPNSNPCVSSDRAEAGYSSQQVDPAPDLATLATAYLADPRAGRLSLRSKVTGEVVNRHTAAHFVELVEPYGFTGQEARAAYKAERERLTALEKAEWERFFAQLKRMTDAELIAYVDGGCKREIAELARQRSIVTRFDQHKYQTRLKCAKRHLDWRGIVMPKAPAQPSAKPSKPQRPKAPKPVACQPLQFKQPPQVDYARVAAGIVDSLRARQAAQQVAQ